MLADMGLSSISYILSPVLIPFKSAGESAATVSIGTEARGFWIEGGGELPNGGIGKANGGIGKTGFAGTENESPSPQASLSRLTTLSTGELCC
jgi:hypothetical protein